MSGGSPSSADPALVEQFLDITIAQCDPGLEASRKAIDLSWEEMAMEGQTLHLRMIVPHLPEGHQST